MKKFKLFSALLAVGLFINVGLVPNVVAQTGEETTTEETTKPTPAEIKARIEERKAKHQLALEAAEKLRLATKCKPAQGRVNVANNAGFGTRRLTKYNELTDKLANLVEKLQAADVDTSELEENLGELKAKIEVFKTDLEAYKVALEDLKEMNCADDPEGFKASLQEARELKETVKSSAKDIHEYLKTVVKETLKEMRAAIASVKNEDKPEEARTEEAQ